MREIVLDTETTGLDPFSGDWIVEIGGVELLNHVPTGRTYHQYINPERDMPEEAFRVHGLSSEFLSDKPVFSEIADDFVAFVGDSKMVIHNASFDIKFINAELGWVKRDSFPWSQAVDTLDMARRRFPGAQNNLDALCRRFGVDNSNRQKHGALLDSELLAEVYLSLQGGRQHAMALNVVSSENDSPVHTVRNAKARPIPLPARLTEEESARHKAFIADLGNDAVWNRYLSQAE